MQTLLAAGIMVSSIGVDTGMAARAAAQTAGDDVPVDTASGGPVGEPDETGVDESEHADTESWDLDPANEAGEHVETEFDDSQPSEHAVAESPELDRVDETGSDAFDADVAAAVAPIVVASPVASPAAAAQLQDRVTPPVAGDDTFATPKNVELRPSFDTDLLANDFQAEGIGIKIVHPSVADSGFTVPRHGTLRFGNSDGTFTSIRFVPEPGFVGTDSFTYRVWPSYCDGDDNDPNRCPKSNIATVTIHVVNRPPDAAPDTYTTPEGTTLTVPAPGVLANDRDPDGDTIGAHLVTGPGNGTLSLDNFGAFTYSPNPGFTGIDSFTYNAHDRTDGSRSGNATVTIHVQRRPRAVDDPFYIATPGAARTVEAPGLLTNDDPGQVGCTLAIHLQAELVTDVEHGELTLRSDGGFTYIPDADFVGVDHFTYRALCDFVPSAPATATITVGHNPIATPDHYRITTGTSLSVAAPGPLANDSAPPGCALRWSIGEDAQHGRITGFSFDGGFSYQPDAGFVGTDGFTYYARCAGDTRSSGETGVSIEVAPAEPEPNQAPTIDDIAATVDEGRPVELTIVAVDPEGQALTFAVTSGPDSGTVSGTGPTFTYTSDLGFAGTDTFTAEVCDPLDACATGKVTIEVAAFQPPSEPPDLGGAASVEPGEVEPDGTVTVTGTGFEPGETVFVVQYPAGIRRVGGPADTTGAVSFTFTMNAAIDPENVRPGDHEMFLFGAEQVLAGPVRVVPGPPAELILAPSATTVDQGSSITIDVTGIDSFDNPTGDITDQVAFTSSVATDVVDGNWVTFPTASPHVITATHPSGATAAVTIEVTPATAPATTTPPTSSPPTTISAGTGSPTTSPGVTATARAVPGPGRSKGTLPRTGVVIGLAIIGFGVVGAGVLANLGALARHRRQPPRRKALLS